MTARTHDTAAFAALSVIFLINTPQHLTLATVIVGIFANLIGGIAPDIDQPTAPLWRNLPVGTYIGKIFATLSGGHRFISHSLIGVALFTFIAHWLLLALHPIMSAVDVGLVTWAFAIGMTSHLVMDTLTKEGVPWLLPLPHKFGLPPVRKLRITTGKFLETGVLLPALILSLGWWYFAHYDQLVAILKYTITR